MSYFKNPSNIPSAIAIWWSTGQQTGVWWSRGQQTGDIRLVTRRPGQTIYHPPGGSPQFWVVLEINKISMHIQYTKKSLKWCPKTSKSVQNEVQTGTWNHQIHEKVKHMKSNENQSIYNVFERLGRHESANFPIENHHKSCLQSKHAFWHPKSQKISKSDPKWSPMGDPKSIKNHWKSILAPSRVPLSASVPNLITKMVSKDLQMDPKWSPGDPKKT